MLGPLKRFENRIFLLLAALMAVAPVSTAFAQGAQHIEGRPFEWQMGLPLGETVVAKQLYQFHNLMLVIITLIAAFVLVLLAYVTLRYRRKASPNPSRTTHNTLIEIIWTVVPVLILVVIAIPSFKIMYYMDRAEKPEMSVKITGHQWYWSYEMPDQKIEDYASNMIPLDKLAPDQVRLLSTDYPLVVPVDTTIQLLFTGADVIHSWLVGDLGVQKSAMPGRLNESWMKVDKEGTYFGQCTQICGDRHGYMPIEVRAVSKEKFAAWVDAVQKSTAADKMRDANEKVLGLDYSRLAQPAKAAALAAPEPQVAASR